MQAGFIGRGGQRHLQASLSDHKHFIAGGKVHNSLHVRAEREPLGSQLLVGHICHPRARVQDHIDASTVGANPLQEMLPVWALLRRQDRVLIVVLLEAQGVEKKQADTEESRV